MLSFYCFGLPSAPLCASCVAMSSTLSMSSPSTFSMRSREISIDSAIIAGCSLSSFLPVGEFVKGEHCGYVCFGQVPLVDRDHFVEDIIDVVALHRSVGHRIDAIQLLLGNVWHALLDVLVRNLFHLRHHGVHHAAHLLTDVHGPEQAF